MLSIPATKAFEIGSGFRGTEVPGSQHNDQFVADANGRLRTVTNWSGGIQGGITNGENIYFRYVASNHIRIKRLCILLQDWLQIPGNYFPAPGDGAV